MAECWVVNASPLSLLGKAEVLHFLPSALHRSKVEVTAISREHGWIVRLPPGPNSWELARVEPAAHLDDERFLAANEAGLGRLRQQAARAGTRAAGRTLGTVRTGGCEGDRGGAITGF